MAEQPKPTTMTENAREAAKLVAKEQQQRPGKKVRVVATAEGFDGFKVRAEGERFVAWWFKNPLLDPKHPKHDLKATPEFLKPSWQLEEKEYDKQAKVADDDGDES